MPLYMIEQDTSMPFAKSFFLLKKMLSQITYQTFILARILNVNIGITR